MGMPDKLELLDQLRNEVESLELGQDDKRDAWERRAEMIISKIFGRKSKYLFDLAGISFHPMVYPARHEHKRSSWTNGKTRASNLVNTMIEELKLFGEVSDG